MPESNDNSVAVETSGNVRIETSSDELTVTFPVRRTARDVLEVLYNAIYLFCFVFRNDLLRLLVHEGLAPQSWLPSSIDDHFSVWVIVVNFLAISYFVAISFQHVQRALGGKQILHCTRECIELMTVDFGQTSCAWTFQKDAVAELIFAGRFSFLVGKTRKYFLGGVMAPEGAQILDALYQLGYDTVRTPKMQKMIARELSRRRFWQRVWG